MRDDGSGYPTHRRLHTLGPQPDGRARLAGQAAAWGQSMYVQKGATLGDRKEILRASVGHPVSWAWCVWLDGAAPGAFGPGATGVTLHVVPSLGRGGAFMGLPFVLKPGIGSAFFATSTPGGQPATELQIFVQSDDVAVTDYTVCATAAPIFSLYGPQG